MAVDDLGNLFHVPAENKHTLEKLTTNKFKPDGVGVGGGLVNDVGEAKKLISQADRNKLNGWKYAPNDELYLKYKDVYDNPKYFNQETGDITWPGTKGDPNIDGFVNGEYKIETLKPGTEIDRYGSNPSGQYFSPAGSSYESRALPPHMSEQPYTKYRVVKDFDVKSGKIAPWFDEVGGGIQFNSQIKILDKYGDAYDATVENLVKLGYIKKIDCDARLKSGHRLL